MAAGGASGNSIFVMVSGIPKVGTCRIGERVLLRTLDRNDTLREVEVGKVGRQGSRQQQYEHGTCWKQL